MHRRGPRDETAAPGVVPTTLAAAAALAWRVLLVGLAIWALILVLGRLRVVVVPLVFAAFFTALLHPAVGWLKRHSIPSSVAAVAVLGVVLASLAGLVVLAGVRFAGQFTQLADALAKGWDRLLGWVASTFPVSEAQIRDGLADLGDAAGGNVGSLLVGGATTLAHVLIMAALVLVFTFFLLKDGPEMYGWVRDRLPADRRRGTDAALTAAWRQLSAFSRGQLLIALVDAVLIAIALVVIGVPLVLTLALITFVAGFIPLVGPVVAGALAALVALSAGGLADALWVVAASFAIQQAEGNLLQPFVLGRVLKIHPMAILAAVTIGGIVGGVVGAFAAAPVLAATVAAASAVRRAADRATDERERTAEAA